MENIRNLRRSQEERDNEILEFLQAENVNRNFRDAVLRVPSKYRYQYFKTLKSPDSKATALKMKCYECVGFEDVPSRVGGCTCRLCPLWLHRPYQESTEEAIDTDS